MKSYDRFLNFFLRLLKSYLHIFLGDFTLPGLTDSDFPLDAVVLQTSGSSGQGPAVLMRVVR